MKKTRLSRGSFEYRTNSSDVGARLVKRPPYDADSPLAWKNYVCAQTSSAALGLLSSGIHSMACVFVDDVVELHFAVPALTPELSEDIEDIMFELDVKLDLHTKIEIVLHEGCRRFDPLDDKYWPLYRVNPDR